MDFSSAFEVLATTTAAAANAAPPATFGHNIVGQESVICIHMIICHNTIATNVLYKCGKMEIFRQSHPVIPEKENGTMAMYL